MQLPRKRRVSVNLSRTRSTAREFGSKEVFRAISGCIRGRIQSRQKKDKFRIRGDVCKEGQFTESWMLTYQFVVIHRKCACGTNSHRREARCRGHEF